MLSMVNALMAVFVRAMGNMGAKATAEPTRVEARTVFSWLRMVLDVVSSKLLKL